MLIFLFKLGDFVEYVNYLSISNSFILLEMNLNIERWYRWMVRLVVDCIIFV